MIKIFSSVDEDNIRPTPEPRHNCPEGYYSYWYSCYKLVSDEQVTWDEAESACAMANASLVSIHTTPKNAAMLLAHEQNNRTSFWIGLHDPGVSGNNFAKLSMLN